MAVAAWRRRLAGSTPAPLRKAVRMAEHYGRRWTEWNQVAAQSYPADARSAVTVVGSLIAAPITGLRRLDGFEPPLLLADTVLQVRGVGRFAVRAGTDDIIHVLPAREPIGLALLRETLQLGDTFVDAGANIGFYSIVAGRLVGVEGQVVAVEMMPETAVQLRANVALNDASNVRVVECALSDRDGDTVTASSNARKLGQASIRPANSGPTRDLTVSVGTQRLDTLLRGVKRVRLIKMDLEGAEALALAGAYGVLDRVDAIVFENNTRDPRIAQLLGARGFTIRELDHPDYIAEREG
ncbi:FkbM family methyltransferase [Sphingomonas sp.]|uniref:FkbM family methyltransferase n=1 Tax=Sphingomonas sp. TaxID=28214 RepID=UPI0035C81CA9